jgi:GNAT superfamily N-acetyltransferase
MKDISQLQFFLVKFDEVAEKVAFLLSKHRQSVEETPKPDWKQYLAASEAGQCLAAIAVDDNKLVGYSVYIAGDDINHKGKVTAENTAFFVLPEYPGAGLKLLKSANELLLKLGAKEINYTLGDIRSAKILKRMKPSKTYTVYSFHE